MTSKGQIFLGFAWYRPDQWEDLKKFCEDREELEDTYELWKQGAEKAFRDMRASGQTPLKVDFDLVEFKMWCSALNRHPVGASRSEFTATKLRESHER